MIAPCYVMVLIFLRRMLYNTSMLFMRHKKICPVVAAAEQMVSEAEASLFVRSWNFAPFYETEASQKTCNMIIAHSQRDIQSFLRKKLHNVCA